MLVLVPLDLATAELIHITHTHTHARTTGQILSAPPDLQVGHH